MTAPVVQPQIDHLTDDVLAERREVRMLVHRPIQVNSVIAGCGWGKPLHRFGAYVVNLELGTRCRRYGCWGDDR